MKKFCKDCGKHFLDDLDIKYHNSVHDYEGFEIGIRDEYV